MEAWRDYQKGLVLFVDARSPAEYRAGHLPGAVSVPVEEAGAKQGRMGLPEGRELVIYCSDPECPKSAQLASLLLERGVSGIKVMTGGWAAWYEAGLPADELGGE
jgi:rhodanese-related sulfurtransferase